ncbi:MAG: hypothetical protein ACLVEV_10605 [Lachnospiraceae bacterium]|uniref:hypothetical protein n=1 Tax=Parablautia sp. Marseille-Q6255 TaxID=3039593 RepID=UPI0024BCB83D|nr:hypothetical protein [Parablautia sp. Marseille-Q6255]
MPKHKKYIRLLLFSLIFLYLLLFPAPALSGARDGLLLWYRNVLPVLFPFMLLSGAMLRLGVVNCLPSFLQRLSGRLFHCSQEGSFAVLTGFLCGLPMGAKVTADLFHSQKISRVSARHLTGFVNNLSPVFLLSFLSAQQLQNPQLGVWFLLDVLGAALIYGILTAPASEKQPKNLCSNGASDRQTPAQPDDRRADDVPPLFDLIDHVICDAVQSIVKLGVCIMVFSMAGSALAFFWRDTGLFPLLVRASIEVTGGIALICESSLALSWKYVLLCGICAFGGWSAIAQTAAIAGFDKDLAKYYIKSRVMITLLSLLLSVCTLCFFLRGLL